MFDPYHKTNNELMYMTDIELDDYLIELKAKMKKSKGYGRIQFKKEIVRVEKVLRITEEDR